MPALGISEPRVYILHISSYMEKNGQAPKHELYANTSCTRSQVRRDAKLEG